LAHEWAAQASAIADAAGAGNGCLALRLANSLRNEVIAAEGELPLRFRSPLLISVNALANRLTCALPPVTVQPPLPAPQEPHGHRGNSNGNGNGNGQDNGGGNGGGD
jgi:hypothetical protein